MKLLNNPFNKFIKVIKDFINTQESIDKKLSSIKDMQKIMVDLYLQNNLCNNPHYSNPLKLNKYEFQVYSQNGEDGIIEEIFNRIGTTNKYFVEFGVGNGLENNTVYLLLKGWNGCWIEGDTEKNESIENKFGYLITGGKLTIKNAYINAENIEVLFKDLRIPGEFDLLSIDIDGNDYWVWEAVKHYSPRVLVIEYNALFRPPLNKTVKYNASKIFEITSYFGASLKSLEILGREKGYNLVGCNFTGINAFFVREDLVKNNFFEPFTAENHYEPPRYFLLNKIGHDPSFGPFENK